MNQYEVPAALADELPEVGAAIGRLSAPGNVYATIQLFTNYMQQSLACHRMVQAVNCVKTAGKLYDKGNAAVKNAIENVFIHSFSAMRLSCTAAEWQFVEAKMPISLYSSYHNQLMSN